MFAPCERIAAQRVEAFEHLRDTALEGLGTARIADGLGDAANVLKATLENSVVLHTCNGVLVFPDEQHENDRLGVHPILASERRAPTWKDYDLLLPSTRQFLAQNHPEYLAELQHRRAPKQKGWLKSFLGHLDLSPCSQTGFIAVPDETGQAYQVMYSRSFILANMKLLKRLSGTGITALVAHEIDHGVKVEEFAHRSLTSRYGSREEIAEMMSRLVTYMEKSAYDITAKIIGADPPTTISVDSLLSEISGLPPEKAGLHLNRLAIRQIDGAQVYFRALSALALTKVFGDESSLASDNEVISYHAANLVRH